MLIYWFLCCGIVYIQIMGKQYRLLTRSSFDGFISAILLKDLGLIHSVCFAHPKDIQDCFIIPNASDILVNLPYCNGIYMAFDHQPTEDLYLNNPAKHMNYVLDANCASTARVIYNHFGGAKAFPQIDPQMLDIVDRADNAHFTTNEITNPQGWVLLHFLMDTRTGLGRFHDFRISNCDLLMELMESCANSSIKQVLQMKDVQERLSMYKHYEAKFLQQLHRCTYMENSLAVTDLRQEGILFPGNPYLIYATHPKAELNLHIQWGFRRSCVQIQIEKSIFNRQTPPDLNAFLLEFGGIGNAHFASCQVDNEIAETVILEIKQLLKISVRSNAKAEHIGHR
jgi:nanoRNase/pAp phosphatase (c-di-AMP/oligoRNAs hydrolase)